MTPTAFIFLAQNETPPSSGGGNYQFILIILMFVMIYFVMIRPQRKQQKEHRARVEALKNGDKIVTSGGLHGLVTNIKDSTVIVKIADKVKVELEKNSVTSVTKKSSGGGDAPADAPADS